MSSVMSDMLARDIYTYEQAMVMLSDHETEQACRIYNDNYDLTDYIEIAEREEWK